MNIFIIFFSLVLVSALTGSAADEKKIIVFSGSPGTFYCTESNNIERCWCKSISYCNNLSTSKYSRYEVEPHLGNSKITVLDLSPFDFDLCYRCGKQVYHFEVRQENCPSVVIGKLGGSVMMSCTSDQRSSERQYWCRKEQNRSCSKGNLSNSSKEIPDDSKGTVFLEKHDLRTEDSGTYQCVFKYGKTCNVNLELLQSQNGLHAPTTFNVMPGQQVKIACKYIQEYVNASKFWECSTQHTNSSCSTDFEVEDDRSRSELVLTIANVRTSMNLNVYTCKVATSGGGFHSVSTTLMVGLTAPHTATGTRRGRVTLRCQYENEQYYAYSKYWCKLNYLGECGFFFSKNEQQYNYNNKWSFVEDPKFFDLIIERLQTGDAGTYRCGFYRQNYVHSIKANVELSIIEPRNPPTTTRKTIIERKTRSPTKIVLNTHESSFRSNSLLYGIFFLLTVIAVTLLIILVKLYCKRRRERVQSPDLGGGTFQMNDLKTNIHLLSPDLPLHQHPYTGTMDNDSSSTSSESSGHSFGNISSGPRPQYLTIIPCPRDLDYENVSEGMHPALSDYENVTTDMEQDYVNVSEAPNSSFTEDEESESCQPTENCGQNDNTSESSSDESDEEAVNYTTVVFT
ncbi:uncharacterized protein LOC103047578 [Astyanax mexicanus]|uniref:uncharacterized protein LOC103047578 n=1 Tax=Astyanax mexicanus TaxID=7994 RepID=UPI0020CAFB8A|nr:uncharacterized protein LOC103047578 [Astyanax mexicanus]